VSCASAQDLTALPDPGPRHTRSLSSRSLWRTPVSHTPPFTYRFRTRFSTKYLYKGEG